MFGEWVIVLGNVCLCFVPGCSVFSSGAEDFTSFKA